MCEEQDLVFEIEAICQDRNLANWQQIDIIKEAISKYDKKKR